MIKRYYLQLKEYCKTHIISELTVLLIFSFIACISIFAILCMSFNKLRLFRQPHVDYESERMKVMLDEQDFADRLKAQKDDDRFNSLVNDVTKRLGENACITTEDGTLISDSMLNEIDLNKWKERSTRHNGVDSDGNFYSYYPFVRNNTVYFIFNKTQLNGVYSYSIEWIILISAVISITYFFIKVIRYIRKKTLYIEQIGKSVNAIQHGKLDTIVPIEGNDELSQIALSLNEMQSSLNELIAKEKEETKRKNELITGMAHDIKTPITVILGYLDIINNKKYETEAKRDEYLKKAYVKAESLRKMILMLFDAAKSQNIATSNSTDLHFDLMLRQAVSEYEPIIEEKSLTLETAIHNTTTIYANTEHMHAIIDNLLSNAVKYCTPNGKISVSLYMEADDIIFKVANSSDKITDSELDQLFDEFYRINKSRNDYVEGNGLGLYIVKKTLAMYKGCVWAEYLDNTFTITTRIK